MKFPKLFKDKKVLSWALYDWANSAFATTVMAGFFPIFFKQYWSTAETVNTSTLKLGIANSVASLVLAFLAPVLGSIADQGGYRKRLLAMFAFVGAMSTIGFYFIQQGHWQGAVAMYILGSLGFAAGNIFYDSLMVETSRPEDYDRVSGYGFGLGYLGGGLLFVINVLMYLKPQWFGFEDGVAGIRFSFVTVGLWWILFSIPIFKNVPEGKSVTPSIFESIVLGLKTLKHTFLAIRQHKPIFTFLLAYLFYIDGVNTIIKMAVDYGMSIGFKPSDLITALIITQFVGFPAAIGFGALGTRIGAKAGIYIAIGVYGIITVWGYFMSSPKEFYLMAAIIGLVQGGIQALSRSYFARMIPTGQSAEFFGFFNMVGKFSAILGPVIVGYVSYSTGNARLSILSILSFFIVGSVLLLFSKPKLNN